MADQSTKICFTSDLFQIEPGEDEQTNPYRFGKQLSHWLADKLSADGLSRRRSAVLEATIWQACNGFERAGSERNIAESAFRRATNSYD